MNPECNLWTRLTFNKEQDVRASEMDCLLVIRGCEMKIATIQVCNSSSEFDRLVNQFNKHNNVSFTQTHIFSHLKGTKYIAVLFYTPQKKLAKPVITIASDPIKASFKPVTGNTTVQEARDLAFKATLELPLNKCPRYYKETMTSF